VKHDTIESIIAAAKAGDDNARPYWAERSAAIKGPR
jgi:hypothetical protein